MNIFKFINEWPQFIQHIIIYDIAPFNQIVQLSQTCKKLHKYFHKKLKAFSLLCDYHIKKATTHIFRHSGIFYENEYEKQLFIKTILFQKNKMPLASAVASRCYVIVDLYFEQNYTNLTDNYITEAIRSASKNGDIKMLNKILSFKQILNPTSYHMDIAAEYGHVNVLEWTIEVLLNKGLKYGIDICYSTRAVNKAAANGHIKVLNWFYMQNVKYGLKFKYDAYAIDNAAANGHIKVLDWFYEHSLVDYKYTIKADLTRIKFKYSHFAVDDASKNGHIDILNWFLNHFQNNLKYGTDAIDGASFNTHIDVLDWWLNSGLKLKYTEASMDRIEKNISFFFPEREDVLNWWLNASKQYPNQIELKYTEKALKSAIKYKSLPIINWWLNSGLKLKNCSKQEIEVARSQIYADIQKDLMKAPLECSQ